jgi:hypothetical protein
MHVLQQGTSCALTSNLLVSLAPAFLTLIVYMHCVLCELVNYLKPWIEWNLINLGVAVVPQ